LTLKDLADDPWNGAEKKFAVGTEVPGTVAKRAKFGYGSDLAEGVTGLLVFSRMAADKKDSIEPGDTVTVTVDSIDLDERRIGLSMGVGEAVKETEAARQFLKKQDAAKTEKKHEASGTEFGAALSAALSSRKAKEPPSGEPVKAKLPDSDEPVKAKALGDDIFKIKESSDESVKTKVLGDEPVKVKLPGNELFETKLLADESVKMKLLSDESVKAKLPDNDLFKTKESSDEPVKLKESIKAKLPSNEPVKTKVVGDEPVKLKESINESVKAKLPDDEPVKSKESSDERAGDRRGRLHREPRDPRVA
jgi:ribosomal protein S1